MKKQGAQTVKAELPYDLGTIDDYFVDDSEWSKANGGVFILDATEIRFPTREMFGRLITRAKAPANRPKLLTDPTHIVLDETIPFSVLAPLEVRKIWQQGWTGKGRNVLLVDNFYNLKINFNPYDSSFEGNPVRGYMTAASVFNTAPRTNLFAYESALDFSLAKYGERGLRGIDNSIAPLDTYFAVVNISFLFDYFSPIVHGKAEFDRNVKKHSKFQYFLDIKGEGVFTNIKDSVITKAAGDYNGKPASHSPLNTLLVEDETTSSRTLIVGALNGFADEGNTPQLASYSASPGNKKEIRDRFLVESGTNPFAESTVAINNTFGAGSITGQTSFAAPRVAGYVAIIRQKFPNLIGADAADILLNTATYRGLTGSDIVEESNEKFTELLGRSKSQLRSRGTFAFAFAFDCEPCTLKDAYGQGRVDLPKALSPQGRLR